MGLRLRHGYRKMRLEANRVRWTVGDEELSRVGRRIGVDACIDLAVNDDLYGVLRQVGIQWIELRAEMIRMLPLASGASCPVMRGATAKPTSLLETRICFRVLLMTFSSITARTKAL